MRPVKQVQRNEINYPHQVHAVLMNYWGSYCSTCERPLPGEAWVWDSRTGQTFDGSATGADWPHLLLLCYNCNEASKILPQSMLNQLLLPHKEITFRLGSASPFIYELQEVRLVLVIDEDEDYVQNSPASPVVDQEIVIVKANPDYATANAQATIDYFALNTAYYEPEENTFFVPKAEYLAGVDRRCNQRTDVWMTSERLLALLLLQEARDFPQAYDAILAQIRLAIAESGFWSTWVTVVLNMFDNPEDLLNQIFLPDLTDLATNLPGPGPHNTFPGTKWDS